MFNGCLFMTSISSALFKFFKGRQMVEFNAMALSPLESDSGLKVINNKTANKLCT